MYRFSVIFFALLMGCQQEVPPPASAMSEAEELTEEGIRVWSYDAPHDTPSSFERASEILERAVALDSTNGLAHAYLTHAYLMMGFGGKMDPAEAESKARTSAEKAMEYDGAAAAYWADAIVKTVYDQDFEAAEIAFKRAIEIEPDNSNFQREYGGFLGRAGRNDEAIERVKRAIELDPGFLSSYPDLCTAYRRMGNHDEAIQWARRGMELEVSSTGVHRCLSQVLTAQGDYEEAISVLDERMQVDSTNQGMRYDKAFVLLQRGDHESALNIYEELGNAGMATIAHARMNNRDEALTGIEEIKALFDQGQWGWSWTIAEAYESLGEMDEALSWYETAYEVRAEQTEKAALVELLWWLSNAESAASLRDEPRIQAILERGVL